MDESQAQVKPQVDDESPTTGTSRRGFLIRVGGGLAAAAVAPFIMAGPAQAAGRCQYYYCEFMGFYISPYCTVYYWFSCFDLDTGFHCFDRYEPV